MQQIGFICDLRPGVNPINSMGLAWLERSVPMAKFLYKFGIQLVIYAPWQVDTNQQTVAGYCLESSQFVKVEMPIPKVNGSWYIRAYDHHESTGPTMIEFRDWAKKYNIDIYPSIEFDAFVNDKYASHIQIEKIKPGLSPYTEQFNDDLKQINAFLTKYPIVFIKPRYGGHGDNILVIKKKDQQLSCEFYANQEIQRLNAKDLQECETFINAYVSGRVNIIQEGITVLRKADRTFDIRLMTTNDGREWRVVSMARISKPKGDVSNVGQGGFVRATLDHLRDIFPYTQANDILAQAYATSTTLSQALNRQTSIDIIEIAYDMLVDEQGALKLVEINSCPMIMMPGSMTDELAIKIEDDTPKPAPTKNYQNILSLSNKELPTYLHYTLPYANCLAEFLMTKLIAKNSDKDN